LPEKGLSHDIVESEQGTVGVDSLIITTDDRKKLAEFDPTARFEVPVLRGQFGINKKQRLRFT
jgi:hypothetical protein